VIADKRYMPDAAFISFARQVEIYSPHHNPKTVGVAGILDDGDVLPGFQLPVKDISPEE